jgi:hypothetical protein
MKVKLFTDGDKPKVNEEKVRRVVEKAGFMVADKRASMGIVIGGDGIFSRYGRTESLPLLFIGVRSKTATGSKAYLAAATFNELPRALETISAGLFRIREHRRLTVSKNGRKLGDVFTDMYLQRGAESNCLRYRVMISGREVSVDESVIGDGVVIATSAGSTGYYSYPDKIKGGSFDVSGHSSIRDDQVGICHIVPTFMERKGTNSRVLRYTVPWGSRVELMMTRRADARLYGLGPGRGGRKVRLGDRLVVEPSSTSTKVVVLES